MPTYATQTDLTDYIEGFVVDDSDAVDRLIERAERDIDSILGAYDRDDTTGLKITLADFDDWQTAALTRAVCAQVEYRFTMGEAFMVRAQREEEWGPDFRAKGKVPYIGPKAWRELEETGLVRLTGKSTVSKRDEARDDRIWREPGCL